MVASVTSCGRVAGRRRSRGTRSAVGVPVCTCRGGAACENVVGSWVSQSLLCSVAGAGSVLCTICCPDSAVIQSDSVYRELTS